MLTEAEQEMLVSLHLEPGQLDVGNMLGVIYARQGNKTRASSQWRELIRKAPDYAPARDNLTILDGEASAGGGEGSTQLFPGACTLHSKINDLVRERFDADGRAAVISIIPQARGVRYAPR